MNFKFKRLYHRVFSIFLVIVLSVLSVPTSAVAKEGNEEPLNISTSAPISESTIATDLSQEVIWPVVSDEEAMRREQLIQNGYSPDDYSVSEYKQMAAKGELQPLAAYPAVLADGVYAIKNIGNSSGSTGFYLDTALAHWLPGYNMQQYKFENGTSPLDNFEVSTLFKITRNTEKGSYVIRIMRNNVLSFGIHVNSDGSNEILTKKIPLDDSEVALNDTYVITASGSGYYIRKYGTTNLIATKETTASGAAGAPDSYLYASTAIGDQTRWTFSAYTGPERNEMTMLGSGSLEVAKTSTLDPVFYSTRPGYNVVSLNMSQVPTSYYHLSGPSDYGIYSLTPHQGTAWTVGIFLKNGTSANASSILVKLETWNIALPIDEGIYFFENAEFPGKYMQIDDDSSSSTNGAIMELWDFDGDDDQRWNLDHISDGYYKITSVASGKALTMPTEEGASVTQTPYEESFDRLWYITENSNGTYSLQAYVFYLAAGDGIFTSDGRNVEGRSAQNDAKDEWNLTKIQFSATVYNFYDKGYFIGYSESEATSVNKINSYMDAVAERYLELFGLEITIPSAEYYESAIDTCKETVNSSNIDTLCSHTDPHTILFYTTNSVDIHFNANTLPSESNIITKAYWTCHRIKTTSDTEEYNRCYSYGRCIYMLELSSILFRERDSKGLLMHELNHQYGAKDHYHEFLYDENGNRYCRGGEICSDCGTNARSRGCIMNDSRANISAEDIICAECRKDILSHLKSYH